MSAGKKEESNIKIAEPMLKKILILDDEPDIVNLISQVLKLENIDTKGITSTKDLDAALENYKPDVLFTDISMPNMTGIQILEKLSKSHPQMPIVFISGYINKSNLEEATRMGVFSVIEKPFEITKIADCALSALKRCQATFPDSSR